MEYAITRALKTILTDGYRPPVIGFTVAHGEAPILQSPLRPRFEAMGALVGVPLDGHSIPSRVDVLVILGPSKPLNERALYTIDQFLVGGGTVIMLLDYRQQSRQFPDLLLATAPGLSKLLGQYGVHVETGRSVIDRDTPANTMVITDPQVPPIQTAHPLYVYAQPTQDDHPVTRGIADIITPLASHIDLAGAQKTGLEAHPLLVTSDASTRRADIKKASAEAYDMANDDDIEGPATVGAIIRGHFKSAYTQDTVPEPPKASPFAPQARDLPFRKRSDTEGRVLLVTSGTRMLAALHNGQLFLENAVEWGGSDEALTALRSRRAETPRLEDTTAEQRHFIRAINLLGPGILLFLFGFAFRIWRRRA